MFDVTIFEILQRFDQYWQSLSDLKMMDPKSLKFFIMHYYHEYVSSNHEKNVFQQYKYQITEI